MLFLIISLLAIGNPTFEAPAPNTDPVQVVDELGMLEDLIAATEFNLAKEKELRKLVLVYQEELSLYIKNSSDKDLVLRVAKTAHKLLSEIKTLHLVESFQPNFISELTLFSQIALKRGILKP